MLNDDSRATMAMLKLDQQKPGPKAGQRDRSPNKFVPSNPDRKSNNVIADDVSMTLSHYLQQPEQPARDVSDTFHINDKYLQGRADSADSQGMQFGAGKEAGDGEDSELDFEAMQREFEAQCAQQDGQRVKMPSIKITRRKLSKHVVNVVKLPDEQKEYDDPFTMKMKEIGIDWNKLQDGAELEFDRERQTIRLGNDYLITQDDINEDARRQIFEFLMPQRRSSDVESVRYSDIFPSA